MENYFEFDTKAKILSGDKALSRVAFELKIRGKNKPLVLSDRGLDKLGLVGTAIKNMGLKEYDTFFDVPVDSSTETVNTVTEKYKSSGCDCVIAVGGGSVIDTAKGVVLSLVSGVSDLGKIEGADAIVKVNDVLFIAVPTTAGTGSEMTSVAVIKDNIKGAKLEYISSFILPDVAVLDPEMTISLPPRITASTAIDALTHAIEAYTCLQKNPISDGFAIASIKLIFESLERVVNNPKDVEGRKALANAATIAGASFSNSMVGAVHSIGHSLGAVCSVAHGDAMAILLPHVMRLNKEKVGDLYGELLVFANPEKFVSTPKSERAEAFICEVEGLLERLNKSCGLATTLSATGKVKKENFDEIVTKAMNDGSAIVNPVPLSRERIIDILEKAL